MSREQGLRCYMNTTSYFHSSVACSNPLPLQTEALRLSPLHGILLTRPWKVNVSRGQEQAGTPLQGNCSMANCHFHSWVELSKKHPSTLSPELFSWWSGLPTIRLQRQFIDKRTKLQEIQFYKHHSLRKRHF